MHFSYTNIFLEQIPGKLHNTYSFVIQRIAWKKCLELFSCKISFRLHKRMLSELISHSECSISSKQSENSRRLWLFPGSVQEFCRKVPGKLRENCWKNFPESRNATNSRISGTGKGKPAGNLGSTLPGPCPHLPCGVFFEIDSSSLLEFF